MITYRRQAFRELPRRVLVRLFPGWVRIRTAQIEGGGREGNALNWNTIIMIRTGIIEPRGKTLELTLLVS